MLELETTISTKYSGRNDTMRDRIPENEPTRRAFVATAAISTASMLLVRSAGATLLKSNNAFPDKRYNNQNQERLMNTVTVKDGTKICYKDWGTGQPIVFSHGWPLNADAWDAQMLFLGQHGYRVIAHDRRGHGRSEQTWEGNEMNTYADDLASLFETLDLKDAVMVGHSTGGGKSPAILAVTAQSASRKPS